MFRSVITTTFFVFLLLAGFSSSHAQPPRQPIEGNPVRTPFSTDVQQEWLFQVMPEADSFSEKEGEPPVWQAYQTDADSGEQQLIGYVFLTADVPPEERGFSAPIAMLGGVNLDNQVTGLKILNYVESYVNTVGDFVADPVFQAQFAGKFIGEDFQVKRDVDGISGATVTSFAISRGIREAARRVAAEYNGFSPDDPVDVARNERILEMMAPYTWEQLLEEGFVHQMVMPIPGGEELILTLAYMGHPALGEYFIGRTAYARAERDAAAQLAGTEMILLAVGGSGFQQFRQDRTSMQQDGPMRRIFPNRLVTAGNADEGMIAGRAEFAGALIIDDNYDITQPITIAYRPLGSLDAYELEFLPTGLGWRLANGDPILSEEEIARIIRHENSAIRKFFRDPPWGVTPWDKVAMTLLIFALVMTAFFRKSARWRWAALTVTLVYLGIMEAGFLSVAHITGALLQGPDVFMNNLPLMMLVVFTLVTTLLWGRIFCSSLCPFGAVQDIITRLTPKRWKHNFPMRVPQTLHEKALYIKYAILALIVGAALIAGNVQIFQYFEPFGTLFFMSGTALLFAILAAILLACVAVPRFYCRYVCPLGAALGVVSLVSPFRIKRVPQCGVCTVCEHACPTGAIKREKIDFKECVRCDICEDKLIKKAGSCRHDMDKIIVRHKELKAS